MLSSGVEERLLLADSITFDGTQAVQKAYRVAHFTYVSSRFGGNFQDSLQWYSQRRMTEKSRIQSAPKQMRSKV